MVYLTICLPSPMLLTVLSFPRALCSWKTAAVLKFLIPLCSGKELATQNHPSPQDLDKTPDATLVYLWQDQTQTLHSHSLPCK